MSNESIDDESQKPEDNRDDDRMDWIADVAAKAISGSPDELVNELDAIRSFLKMWELDFKGEDDPRMAAIMSMLSDVVAVIALSYALKDSAPEPR